jgi:hypothetical protein
MDHARAHDQFYEDLTIADINSRIQITNLKKRTSAKATEVTEVIRKHLTDFKIFFDNFSKEIFGYFEKLAQDNMPTQQIELAVKQLLCVYDDSKFNVDNNPKKLRQYAREFLKTRDFIDNFESKDEWIVKKKFENRFILVRNQLADLMIKLNKNAFEDPDQFDLITLEQHRNLDYSTLRNHYEDSIRDSILSLGMGTELAQTVPDPSSLLFSEVQKYDHSKNRLSNQLYDDFYVNREITNEDLEEIPDEPAPRSDPVDTSATDHLVLSRPNEAPNAAFDKSLVILTQKEKEFFNTLFPKKPTFKLIFRGSTFDFLPQKFHEYCDRRGPTLVVARSDDYLFGGYVDKSWESPDRWSYKSTPNSFLFSATKNQVYRPKSDLNSKSILCRKDSGPCFGMKELALCYEGRPTSNYSHLGMEYGTSADFYCFVSLGKKTLFNVKDYEVYMVSFEEEPRVSPMKKQNFEGK